MLKFGWYEEPPDDDAFEIPGSEAGNTPPRIKDLFEARRQKLIEQFGLRGLPAHVNLEWLASKWGVSSIQQRHLESDAMLYPDAKDKYTLAVNSLRSRGNSARRRFSIAHELGHLLLLRSGLSSLPATSTPHRTGPAAIKTEEDLCDQIAAEILMPSIAFEEDAWLEGWSLRSVRVLQRKYGTSFEATVRRLVDLNPEASLFSVWNPASRVGTNPRFARFYPGSSDYDIPRKITTSEVDTDLVRRAFASNTAEIGEAPLASTSDNRTVMVPAEASAWGSGEFRRVMVLYWPDRETGRV